MSKKTIILKDYSKVFNEITAGAAITPGMLLELTSDGEVTAHSEEGKNVLPMIALEDELQGKGINDAYAEDDPVQVWIPGRGDEAYMILADGQDISVGDFLESNGEGFVQKHAPDVDSSASENTIYTNQIVGQALEAVDLSSSSGAESSGPLGYEKRIKVRIV